VISSRATRFATLHGAKQSITVALGPKLKTVLLFSTVPGAPLGPPPGAAGQVTNGAGASGPPAAPPNPPVSAGPALPLSSTAKDPPPPDRGFVAIEPMAGIPNSMNAAQKGQYSELQSIAPGGSWEESFWISTAGY